MKKKAEINNEIDRTTLNLLYFLYFLLIYFTLPTIKVALVPPNPKEFDSAIFISLFFAFNGTKSKPFAASLGDSKLRVGGAILFTVAKIAKIASTAPAAPSKCPIEDLVELIEISEILFLKRFFIALNSISSPKGVEVPCAFI